MLYAIISINTAFVNDTATTEIKTNLNTLSLHDALPIFKKMTSLFNPQAVYKLKNGLRG